MDEGQFQIQKFKTANLNNINFQYAANPGRFQISETKRNEELDTESVFIKANYPFGDIEIERIEMLPFAAKNAEFSNNKAAEPTKLVKTVMTSEVATLGKV